MIGKLFSTAARIVNAPLEAAELVVIETFLSEAEDNFVLEQM